MTEPIDPFKDFKDPFIPETVRVPLPDGTDAIELGATALNHIEAPLPQVDSTKMQRGDVLTIEFDNDHTETFEVATMHTGSLVFASEDVTHQEAVFKRRTERAEDTDEPISFYGSAISPSGAMRTPSTLRVGSYMVTDLGVSSAAVRNFDLKRPDENGELQDVMLNKTETKTESDSFTHAKDTFTALEKLLEQDGFKFGDDDEDGLSGRYTKVNGDTLVRAARQGFGCGVIPQDEIYAYDAKAQVLRGLRNIPTQGIFQAMVVEGVTKDIFQKAFIAYRNGSEPDWRHPLTLGRSGIGALSELAPVVSYTWLTPSQETPTITVYEDGQHVSKLLRTPKQKGAAFVENMKAHGGEDLIDGVSQMFDIDPNDSAYVYDRLEVDINPGEQPQPREGEAYIWTSQELATEAAAKVKDATSIEYKSDTAVLTVDGHNIEIHTDIDQQIEKIAKTTRLTLGATQRAIGSRVLGRLRPRRQS